MTLIIHPLGAVDNLLVSDICVPIRMVLIASWPRLRGHESYTRDSQVIGSHSEHAMP